MAARRGSPRPLDVRLMSWTDLDDVDALERLLFPG